MKAGIIINNGANRPARNENAARTHRCLLFGLTGREEEKGWLRRSTGAAAMKLYG